MPSLDWIGKKKVVNHHLEVPFKVLNKSYTFSADEKATESENKIIHGDNLEALKALLPEYEGKIKCIYIDPPYNTGNEGWIYNDNVNDPRIKKWLGEVVGKESEDFTRHDKWLCMMYPRLKLLQKLLSDDGAIFISIDDNEQANLKLICDEIFGSGNFVCTFVWQKRYSPPPDTKDIGYMHENVLMFRKSAAFKMNLLPFTEEQISRYTNPDNDSRGPWKATDYTCRFTIQQRPNLNYPITNPNTGEIIYPNPNRAWAMSKETHLQNEKENRIYWGMNGKNHVPALKNFLCDVKQGRMPDTLLKYDEVGHSQEAKQEIKTIFENQPTFDTPKPTRLIERILQIATDKDSIILDSFAGSGTTAHAVLNMNKQDGGNRKFILIEMMDYAETITAERVKRVIKGYADKEGTGGDFSFYELGEPLFINNLLNEKIDTQTIREYIWFTETNSKMVVSTSSTTAESSSTTDENKYFLGKNFGAAYWFYYEKEKATTLDIDFLSTIKGKYGQYIIYADICLLPKDFMQKNNIIFKKIPRDIKRF